MTYGDSACGLGAAMAKPGRRSLFHETTGLVRIATNCVLAPWRLCVEFPSDFVRMKRKVAGKQRRNETGGCCLVSPFNGPTAARRTLRFPPSYRVLQWRNQEIQSAGQRAAAERHGMHTALMGAVDEFSAPWFHMSNNFPYPDSANSCAPVYRAIPTPRFVTDRRRYSCPPVAAVAAGAGA